MLTFGQQLYEVTVNSMCWNCCNFEGTICYCMGKNWVTLYKIKIPLECKKPLKAKQ